jgi:transposase
LTSQAFDALLPQFVAAAVDSVELSGDVGTFRVRAKAGDAACPECRRRSLRVHTRYQRQLADLPLGGRKVQVIAYMPPVQVCRLPVREVHVRRADPWG